MPRCSWLAAATCLICRFGCTGATSTPTRSPSCCHRALRPHRVHAGHQLRRRPGRRPPPDPDRAGLVLAGFVRAAVGVRRVLADARRKPAACRELDHDAAAGRDRGGERHQERGARLRQSEAVGLAEFHCGEPRLGPHHRQARLASRAAAAHRRRRTDGGRRPSRAAGARPGVAHPVSAPALKPFRRLQASSRAAISAVSARSEPNPVEPRRLLQLRQPQLAGARHLRWHDWRAVVCRRPHRSRAVCRIGPDHRTLRHGEAAHVRRDCRRVPLGLHGHRPAALGDGPAAGCTP